MKDERQLRTLNDKGLIGYRAKYKGKNVIAIMIMQVWELEWKECRECVGYIFPDILVEMVNNGPCIDLDGLL